MTIQKGRTQKGRTQKRYKTTGGFIPSVMEGFCLATSKYITPIALFMIHRMISSPTQTQKKQKQKQKQKR
jgi:hypothetical protein